MGIYLAQVNPTVGDLQGNLKILRHIVQDHQNEELIVFPELFLTGYPPQDLLFKQEFLQGVQESIREVQAFSASYPNTAIAFGTPWVEGDRLFSAACVIQAGAVLGIQPKRQLTRFRGFDETLYFHPGEKSILLQLGSRTVAFTLGLELRLDLALELQEAGADLIINLAAIPFRLGEGRKGRAELLDVAKRANMPIIRVSQVGANDGLIFSGGSFAADNAGRLSTLLPEFEVGGACADLERPAEDITMEGEDDAAQVFPALVLGVRDYVRKSGMSKIILGLSGGLDSAVSAVIAAEALGPENVWGITQPGPHSPASSPADAGQVAENLKIAFDTIPITGLYQAVLASLERQFSHTESNVAEENIQARLRGNLLMALSNKFGGLVLSSGNKSELAVGYCTLYGDMSGGLAPIGDCYKTMVYQLAYYINREREIIPWNTIEKPPSAELRPNQRDDESLPPYDILDGILRSYLDDGLGAPEIISQGYAPETVRWVLHAVGRNDYKRRQAPLVLQVTAPLLGTERNMPLAGCKGF